RPASTLLPYTTLFRSSPGLADFFLAVRVQRELRAAAVARRGGAPEAVVVRQDAGRRVAALRQPEAALHLAMDVSGQEAPFHGWRIRPGDRVELEPGAAVGADGTPGGGRRRGPGRGPHPDPARPAGAARRPRRARLLRWP